MRVDNKDIHRRPRPVPGNGACPLGGGDKRRDEEAGCQSPDASLPEPAGKKPGVVAVVNGSDVPLDDFYRELLRVERLVLNTGKPLTCPQIARLRTEVAEGLVRRELLYQESKSKVKVTDAEIDAELKKLKDQYAERGRLLRPPWAP